jgi:glycosyltransferase involved in cell wall biosynthesis
MTLRVLANLCWMVPGGVGGSEEYTTRLLAAVSAGGGSGSGARVRVTVATMAGVIESHPELASLDLEQFGVSGRFRPLRAVVESTWLAGLSRDHDLAHHFGGRIPARRACPAVVTVHDIQPLDLPANFTATKRAYLARALPRSVAGARLVTTPSAWVAERVVDRFSLDATKVCVVPSTYRRPLGSEADDSEPTLGPGVSGMGEGPVIVYPAASHPHKDHATLVEAFGLIRRRCPDARLVLTGGAGRAQLEVERLVASTPGVRHLGRVDSATLERIIARSDVLAFPSRYEGFGLPVLEAMVAGTPVVAAAATALPEVVGNGGVLVEPGSPDAWAEALLDVIEHGVDAATAEAARSRVEHYSPERARERLMAAWATALEGA